MANYATIDKVLNHPNVLQNYFQDVITTQNVLLWILHGKPVDSGGGKKATSKKFTMEVDGGSYIEVPLMLQTNSNMKAYAKDASFDMTANDIGDRAQYSIKSMGGPIPIYGFDLDVSASNKTNLINCTNAYIEQAENSVMNLMTSQLLAAGGSEGANDWYSLYTLIAEDPTADSIGGISAAAYSKWRNGYKDCTGASLATYMKSYINQYRIAATYGIQRPKLILTTASLYSTLYGQLVSNQRYVPDVELVRAGFEGMEFDNCSVIFDASAQSGTVLGINPESLIYATLKGANMKVDKFVQVPGKDLVTSFLTHRGNMCIKDRRTNFNLFDFTTA